MPDTNDVPRAEDDYEAPDLDVVYDAVGQLISDGKIVTTQSVVERLGPISDEGKDFEVQSVADALHTLVARGRLFVPPVSYHLLDNPAWYD